MGKLGSKHTTPDQYTLIDKYLAGDDSVVGKDYKLGRPNAATDPHDIRWAYPKGKDDRSLAELVGCAQGAVVARRNKHYTGGFIVQRGLHRGAAEAPKKKGQFIAPNAGEAWEAEQTADAQNAGEPKTTWSEVFIKVTQSLSEVLTDMHGRLGDLEKSDNMLHTRIKYMEDRLVNIENIVQQLYALWCPDHGEPTK